MIASIHALLLGRKLELLLQGFLGGCNHVGTPLNVKAVTQGANPKSSWRGITAILSFRLGRTINKALIKID